MTCTGTTAMEDDPVIQRIREARHQISEECGHDPYRLAEHYMRLQEENRHRFYKPESRRPGRKAA